MSCCSFNSVSVRKRLPISSLLKFEHILRCSLPGITFAQDLHHRLHHNSSLHSFETDVHMIFILFIFPADECWFLAEFLMTVVKVPDLALYATAIPSISATLTHEITCFF